MVHSVSRVAAICDVHGNLPALEAVLADFENVNPDLVVVGGDVVAGPMPTEVLDRLAQLEESVFFVRGNADREVAAAYYEGRNADAMDAADSAERTAVYTAGSNMMSHLVRISGFGGSLYALPATVAVVAALTMELAGRVIRY
jgi:putative phosphoesterase